MEQDIIRKLREELTRPIESERQVVYILVELRKLLELKGERSQFPVLYFCCDWAVHPLMDRKPAKEYLKLLNEHHKIIEDLTPATTPKDIVQFSTHLVSLFPQS